MGNAAAFTVVSSASLRYFPFGQDEGATARARIAVFLDPKFPQAGDVPLDREALQSALGAFATTFLDAQGLIQNLKPENYDLFINPYGSAFPKEAFGVIYDYLDKGGNWLNIGGTPLSLPVTTTGDTWRPESYQIAYHKKLGITQSFALDRTDHLTFVTAPGFEDMKQILDGLVADEVHELYCRFTVSRDFPSEDGSAGPMDALLYPVILGLNEKKDAVAAPVVVIDRLLGACSGGKWIFVNIKGKIKNEAISLLAREALKSAVTLNVRPSFACYFEGERPGFTVRFWNPETSGTDLEFVESYLTITGDGKKIRDKIPFKLHGKKETELIQVFPARESSSYKPGLYSVEAVVKVKFPHTGKTDVLRAENGFWMYDNQIMSSAQPLTVNGEYLYRNGIPYPVTGTTYMTSDVHRKFVFEPNPSLWNKDFQAMKTSGINMVRTGFWTGWKNMMFDAGSPNESVLRAMDAFILTAQKYDLPVILTLFAFLPESWGGENPYLDPRSLHAQKEFIAAFAQRYKNVSGLLWDLINEPSFCNPAHLWQCRPNYDRFEQEAWREWLRKRYQPDSPGSQGRSVSEIFGVTDGEDVPLPSLADFEDVYVFGDRKPLATIDYHLFAQEKFAEWAAAMSGVIRSNATHPQLVTVGQDEGGTTDSPSNHFFRDHVDFTCVHNWWLNDDLVWDNVVTGTPGKANLVQETGLMFYERMDGKHLLTEEDARNLLERKLAISLGAGGAGFIEWIWNTNPYMMSDNEAAIGLHRADGTEKPECGSLRIFAEFFHANRSLMTGRVEEEIYLLIPHAQLFSPRNLSPEATKKCVRVLTTRFGIPICSVSEYRLGTLQQPPALIVCPSPQTLSQTGWAALVQLVERGSSIYISGPLDLDEHWFSTGRLKDFAVDSTNLPVAEEEYLVIGDREFPLSYRGDKMVRVLKSVPRNTPQNSMMTLTRGKGKIFWLPLPVELSDTPETIMEFYSSLLGHFPLRQPVTVKQHSPGVFMLPTVYDKAILCVCISESDRDSTADLLHVETQNVISVRIMAQRTAILFLDRKSGSIISRIKL